MLSIVDWIWWFVGAVIGLAGIVLTLRALFADRSRGRRRCYKCWYEMTGIDTLRCPECGREAKTERKLHRTHRHWRVAFIGALVIAIGGGCFFGQRVHQTGWVEATPTAVYIIGLPWMDTQSMFDELDRRIEQEQLARWETWLLVHRCIGQLGRDSSPDRLARTANTLGQIEFLGQRLQFEPWTNRTLVSEIDGDGAIDALVALFDHEDPKVQTAAVVAVRGFLDAGINAIPALIAHVERGGPQSSAEAASALDLVLAVCAWVRNGHLLDAGPDDPPRADRVFCQRLGECGTDRDRAMEVFRDGLESKDVETRVLAIACLAAIGQPGDLARIARLVDDPAGRVCCAVILASSMFPYDDLVAGIIARGLAETDGDLNWAALMVLAERRNEPAAREFVDELEAGLRERRYTWVGYGAATYVHLGGDPEIAIDALLDEPEYHDELWRRLRELAELGVESERARDWVVQIMRSEGSDLKRLAGCAYAMLGGDPVVATLTMLDGAVSLDFDLRAALAESGRVSIPVLIEALGSDDRFRRGRAAELLGRVGADAAPALPVLRCLRDEDAVIYVAEDARLAIRRIEWALEQR